MTYDGPHLHRVQAASMKGNIVIIFVVLGFGTGFAVIGY